LAKSKFVEYIALAGVPPPTGPETVAARADGLGCGVVLAVVVPLAVGRDVVDCEPARLLLLEQAPSANSTTHTAIVAVRDGTANRSLPGLAFVIYAPSFARKGGS
jgi:hypothetical protein